MSSSICRVLEGLVPILELPCPLRRRALLDRRVVEIAGESLPAFLGRSEGYRISASSRARGLPSSCPQEVFAQRRVVRKREVAAKPESSNRSSIPPYPS